MSLILRGCKWAIAAILLAALGGAASGYLLGRLHTLHATQKRLVLNAEKFESLLDSFLSESNVLLGTLNNSRYPPCSSQELDWMRQLAFHATHLRDVGHMSNGALECSAVYGVTGLPKTAFKPSTTLWQNYKVYTNLPPYASGRWPVFLIQRGNSFVVEDPEFEDHFLQIDAKFDVFIPIGSAGGWVRPTGTITPDPGMIVSHNWQGRSGDRIYATRCSTASPSCAVAFDSFSAALHADRAQLFVSSALGALIGILAVFIYLFIYQRSHSLAQQLHRAIRRNQLRVLYQPIVDIASGCIVEVEALVRWTDKSGCAISPDVFVATAEKAGFVGELTEFVVRSALRDLAEPLRANPAFHLNVNVTASDLADPRFLPMLERSLAREAVAPHSLAIEITESSTARREAIIETIRELRRRGHYLLIDDFGTGYSSLAYLKDLDVDAIKVDKTFIDTIGKHAVIGNILPQILAMAEKLDLMVVAEGIETPEQAAYFAASNRPILGQGWFFGRPMPADLLLAKLNPDLTQTDWDEMLATGS